jgi:hypothetical protein
LWPWPFFGAGIGLCLEIPIEFTAAVWQSHHTGKADWRVSLVYQSGEEDMPSVLDRVIERELRKELKDALIRFEQQLRQSGVAEENVKNRIRGAKQFVAFLYGRYLG